MLARLVGIQLTTAMVILGIPPLTAALRDEFELSRAQAGLLMTAAFLGVVAASWSGGRIVNAVGVRRSMIGVCIGLGSAFALAGRAPSYALVLLALFVVGVFYSPVTPATNAGVVAWAPLEFRTRAMAIKQMGVTAGAAISAALIPVLVTHYGWRTATAILGAGVTVVGVVSAMWFFRPAEMRTMGRAAPLENRRRVIVLGVATLLLLFVQHSVSTHFILALQDRGVPLLTAGAALSLLQWAATGARYGWAWVADRFLGGNAALALLMLCCGSAAVLLAMTLFDGARWPALAAFLLGGTTQAGNGLMQVILSDAGGRTPASSTGLGMTVGFTGTVIGPPLFGLAADAWSYRWSWFLISLIALTAGIITWKAAPRVDH